MRKVEMAHMIALQSIKLEKQKLKIKAFKKAEEEIHGIIYGIGGPLNDNCLGFTPDQFPAFKKIHDAITRAACNA